MSSDRWCTIQKSIGGKWKLHSSENLEDALREMGKHSVKNQACYNFFVKKPKSFENVKSERAAASFQKSRTPRTSAIIFQKFSDLGHKNMFAGSIITMSMIQHHFCLIIMNEKLINF